MIKGFSLFKIAFRGLVRQRMRTFLTSLAVFIGVFLIITMVSGAVGGEELLRSQFTDAFDMKNVMVGPKGSMQFTVAVPSVEEEEVKPVTPDAIDDLENLNNVVKVQPIILLSGKTLKIEGQEKPIKGIFGSGFNLDEEDRYIQDILAGEVKDLASREVLLSNKISDAYGISSDELIGKKVTIEDDPSSFFSSKVKDKGEVYTFTVVGVIDVGKDQNEFVTSVASAAEMQAIRGGFSSSDEYLSEIGYDQVYLSASSEEVVDEIASKIKEMGFDAMTVGELLDLFGSVIGIVQVVFSMFGVIALIVASVGIVNTMIMSVYERTREIGVMKAIGASRGDIRNIFLSESAMIGFVGGVMGLLGSLAFTGLVEFILLKYVFPAQNIDIDNVFTTPVWLMTAPIILSTIIGILAGLYPALRASRLNPVDALRYE
ncbi:ABC transporter permease [Candidatus Dojkabacteria bacterium]|nr:ABC transporter permease [Candidatus Dojkabacteria bacterium]